MKVKAAGGCSSTVKLPGGGWVRIKKPSPESGWRIADGTLTVLASQGKEGGVGGDIVTKNQYKAFDLSFEFRMTPGANSGVKYFVRLAPDEKTSGSAIGLEYQVLDDSLHPDAKLGRDGDRTLSSLYDLIPANKQPRFNPPDGPVEYGPDHRLSRQSCRTLSQRRQGAGI